MFKVFVFFESLHPHLLQKGAISQNSLVLIEKMLFITAGFNLPVHPKMLRLVTSEKKDLL